MLPCLALVACASHATTREYRMDSTRWSNPYIGKSRDEIVTLWGKPARVESGDLGGTVLVYTRVRAVSRDESSMSAGKPAWPFSGEPPPPSADNVLVAQEIARFYLDASNRVVRCWFDSSLWTSGAVPTPPKS